MTVVGKILVFLNLVFSLAVGTFAVLSYTAGTNWKSGYDKLSKSYQAVQSASATYKAEADRLAEERKALNETLVRVGGKNLEIKDPVKAGQVAAQLLESRRKTIDTMKAELADARAQLLKERKENNRYDTVAKESQKAVERMQADVEKIRGLLKTETDKNTQIVRDMNEMRDRAVAAEIQSRSLREINGRLEGQLQDMARDMARMRATVGTAAARLSPGINPPPEQVEGLVQRVEGNLVSISIGSDAGLTRGHTMQVFRLGQNPRYIGQLRIVDVQANQAVGQVMGRLTTPVQKGDTVASRIMGGN